LSKTAQSIQDNPR